MYFALDREGKLVSAEAFLVYASPFSCRRCGEIVRLRKGVERRAHFAHRSLSRDWECDLYSPGKDDVGGARGLSIARLPGQGFSAISGAMYDASIGARICIDRADEVGARLMLRLPLVPQGVEDVAIELRTRRTIQAITLSTLAPRRFVPVSWNAPPAICRATEGDDRVAAEVNLALDAFRGHDNFFTVTDGKGVLLEAHEDLEFGRSYWLVTQRKLASGALPRSVTISEGVSPSLAWHKYRVDISDSGRSAHEVELIEQVLGRCLRRRSSRPWVSAPFPSHIGSDGVPTFDAGLKTLTLKWEGDGPIEASLNGKNIDLAEGNPPCEYVLSDVACGELAAIVDDTRRVVARIEQMSPFRPTGIRIESIEFATESFEVNGSLHFDPISQVSVRFPSPRLRSVSTLNGTRVDLDLDSTVLEVPRLESFDLASFGLWPSAVEKNSPVLEATAVVAATRISASPELRGIVYSRRGPHALMAMLKLKTHSECLRWAEDFSMHMVLPQLIHSANREERK